MATNSDAPPFAGLKVIDVASWIAGPVAATILADYGADVVKVEMPGVGDGYRALAAAPGMPASEINYMWMMDARNKRSVTLNLKDPQREGDPDAPDRRLRRVRHEPADADAACAWPDVTPTSLRSIPE